MDGFLTRKTDGAEVTAYDYVSRGELLRVDLPDGRTIEYVHDPLGRRIAKKIDGTTVEKYLWSGRTTLLAVYDGADNLLMRFEYADGRMPVAMTKGGARYYLAFDQVGTLRVVTDSTGAVFKRIDYDTFTGTGFGGPPIHFGGGVGAGAGIGISTDGSIGGTQFFVQGQYSGMLGTGYYLGAGASMGVGHTDGPLPTFNTELTGHLEINAGWGASGGGTLDYSGKGPSSISGAIKPGVGYVVMGGSGLAGTVTFATPTIGKIWANFKGWLFSPQESEPCN